MNEDFVHRIQQLVARAGGQSALARKTDMSLGAIQRYLKGGDPTRSALIKLAEAGDVSINWLVYGQEAGEKLSSQKSYKLYGFGESAPQQGWYNEVDYKMGTVLEWPDPNCFAVVAVDDSLKPAGIQKEHVCIISPNTKPQEGDVVFIRNQQGQATLKNFIRDDSEWVYLSGWFLPDENGHQQSYQDQVKRSSIDQIGPAVFVKRR